MDGIQLFQDCRATSCRQFIFTNLPVYQFLPISQFTFYLGVPGTHLIDLRGMKGWVDLGTTQWIWIPDPRIDDPAP